MSQRQRLGAREKAGDAENEGAGLFRLDLPLDIPPGCWYSGTDVTQHAVCPDTTAELVWKGPSEKASSNDGMNCPFQEKPTAVPTTAVPIPVPTAEPSYAPTTLKTTTITTI